MDGDILMSDLKTNVSRPIAFDAVIRLRTSTGDIFEFLLPFEICTLLSSVVAFMQKMSVVHYNHQSIDQRSHYSLFFYKLCSLLTCKLYLALE